MAFITKNANLLLLLLIIVSATTLVAATVYFQSNFERLNNLYNDKLGKLEGTIAGKGGTKPYSGGFKQK